MFFKLCDFIIESNLHLPELEALKDPQNVEYTFRFSSERTEQKSHEDVNLMMPIHEDNDWLKVFKYENGYLFRFYEKADFRVSANGHIIEGFACDGVPDSTISHLLINQIIPNIISGIDGHLVLHASAVEIGDKAVAFTGLTGRGKSTLALFLCKSGFPLISDDFLILKKHENNLFVFPTYPGVRLWDNMINNFCGDELTLPAVAHYTEKKRLRLDKESYRFADRPLPLQTVFLLETSENESEVKIEPINKTDAFVRMIGNIFRLNPDDEERHKLEFNQLANLISSVSFFHMAYPHDFTSLSKVKEKLLGVIT